MKGKSVKVKAFPWRYYLIFALFLLTLPVVVQAQFTYTTNNGSITITGYNGVGGVVVIPSSTNGYTVTGIGAFAFEDCTNVTSVTIPSSVTTIGEGPFLGCTSLTNISVNAGNPSYISSTNGVLFDKALDTLIAYPAGLKNGTYTIPYSPIGDDNVINIADYAFASCTSLTSMYIDVSSIGDFAFFNCTGLTSVIITNELEGAEDHAPINIGSEAFAYCSSLNNVFMANTVTNIGESAFAFCARLTTVAIPNGVTSIGEQAFEGCSGLTSVTIPTNATEIWGLAFAFCTNLTSAYFGGNAPPNDGTAFYGDPDAIVYYSLGTAGWGPTFGGAPTAPPPTPVSEFQYGTYYGSVTITGYNGPGGAVAIPAFINGNPVITIGNGLNEVFPSDVTGVAIPNNVTEIEGFAFESCGLTNVVIPSSVAAIGQSAFENCRSLNGITLPSSLVNIGDGTFYFCTSLTSIVIPGSVTGIGLQAFGNCSSLTNISVDVANQSYSSLNGVFFDKTQDTLLQYPARLANRAYTVPSSVTSIAYGAFATCTRLTNIVIPTSVTNIAATSFQYCINLTSGYFEGNAPPDNGYDFSGDTTTVYYLPGTTGWGPTFGGAPTELWNPQATTFTTAGNQFGFNITGPTNVTIVVEACTNLANPIWLPVSTTTLSGNGTSSFSDPQWTNYPNRYYRFTAP